MEKYESIEILSEEDAVLINNFVEKPNLKLLIFALFFTALSYLASVFLKTFFPLIIFAILSAIVAAWYIVMKLKINSYTKPGTKKIIKGRLDDTFEKTVEMKRSQNFASSRHTFGYFIIGQSSYLVPYNHFKEYKPGDQVVLHLTIRDDIVFKVDH